jgi:hypothetical protein
VTLPLPHLTCEEVSTGQLRDRVPTVSPVWLGTKGTKTEGGLACEPAQVLVTGCRPQGRFTALLGRRPNKRGDFGERGWHR